MRILRHTHIGLIYTFISVLYFIQADTISLGTDLVRKIELNGQTQGTTYHIIYYDEQGRNFQKEVDSLFVEMDKCFSRYRDDSELMISNKLSIYEFRSNHFYKILEESKEVFVATNGSFDPTVLPLVEAYGFGKYKNHELQIGHLDSLRQLVGFDKVKFDSTTISKTELNIRLDFDAIAQGYTVDVIAAMLTQKKIKNYIVEVGGEVRVKGKTEVNQYWTVGIEKSDGSGGIKVVANLTDIAMATSGNYRNFYIKNGQTYNHIVNPKTGRADASALLSATVFAQDAAIADAYATAFIVMGVSETKQFLKANKQLDAFLQYRNENGQISSYITDGIRSHITGFY